MSIRKKCIGDVAILKIKGSMLGDSETRDVYDSVII